MKGLKYLLLIGGTIFLVVESNSAPITELKKHELVRYDPGLPEITQICNYFDFLDDSVAPIGATADPLNHVEDVTSLSVGFAPLNIVRVRGPTVLKCTPEVYV